MSESTEPEVKLPNDEPNDKSPGSSSQSLQHEALCSFQEIMRTEPLKAPKAFEHLVKTSIAKNMDKSYCEKAAEDFFEIFRTFSLYKKRKMTEEISKMDLTAGICLCNKMGIGSSLPWDACFNKLGGAEGELSFERPNLRHLQAMGDNKYGKLGVGAKEETINELRNVLLDEEIDKAYIGPNHSIFVTSEKGIYAAGKASNFLEGYENSEEFFTSPIKLNYVSSDYHTMKVLMTENSTVFQNFNPAAALVIGQRPDDCRVISEGPNWSIVTSLDDEPPTVIQLKNSREKDTNIKIWSSANYEHVYHARLPIIIVNGYRTNVSRRDTDISVCNDGTTYACIRGVFYKGRLELAPADRGRKRSRFEDSEGHSSPAKPDILVAILEEKILPMKIERFDVDSEGKSFIFMTPPIRDDKEGKPYHPIGIRYEFKRQNNSDHIPKNGLMLLEGFQLLNDALYPDCIKMAYDPEGLPSHMSPIVLSLLTLRNLLEVDEKTKITKSFMECRKTFDGKDEVDEDDVEMFEQKFYEELKKSVARDRDIPIAVSGVGWDSIFEGERPFIMKRKSTELLTSVMEEIRVLLQHLVDLPLVYRNSRADCIFYRLVHKIIAGTRIQLDRFEEKQHGHSYNYFGMEDTIFGPCPVDTPMKENLELGDFDEPRLQKIHVEVILKRESDFDDIWFWNEVHRWNTNRLFIQYIDPSLLEHIQGNILNLNKACQQDSTPTRFRKIVDKLLGCKNDKGIKYEIIDINPKVQSIISELPPNEKYVITSNEEKVVEVPKVLFEIFSGYDSARRRHPTGDVNSFRLDFSEKTINSLICCIFDATAFVGMDIELKVEVIKMARFCIFSQLLTKLLKALVVTAEEKDVHVVRQLFWEHRDEMIQIIGELRPDMILFWKASPIPEESYWKDFESVCTKISSVHYRKTPERLRRATEDEDVSDDQMCTSWLQNLMYDEEKDRDVRHDFEKVLQSWNPKRDGLFREPEARVRFRFDIEG